MNCNACKAALDENSRFCTKCGKPVSDPGKLEKSKGWASSNVATEGSIQIKSNHKKDNEKPIYLIFILCVVGFFIQFYVVSIQEYDGFNYFKYSTIVQDVIIQSLAGVLFFPLIHVGIASIWVSKRNKYTRRNIFFGWAVVMLILGSFQLAQLEGLV